MYKMISVALLLDPGFGAGTVRVQTVNHGHLGGFRVQTKPPNKFVPVVKA